MAAHPEHFKINMDLQSKRLHPCFLTIAEAKDHPELVYSDHLPILTEIPVPGAKPVKAISLNVLGPMSFSGLHDATTNREWETPEQTTARYQRIAQGLKQAINLHDTSLLLLQETTGAKDFPDILYQQLGEGWHILIDEDGLISCYKLDRFTNPSATSAVYQNHRTHSLNLIELSTATPLVVHNVWGASNDFGDGHEQYYRDLLALKPGEDPSTIKVVVGNSNCRSTPSPTDLNQRNIITGVISTDLTKLRNRTTNPQLGDHSECAFVSIAGKIHQLCFDTLHFATGKIVTDSRDCNEIPQEPYLYRPILFLDADYISRITIAHMSLQNYQNYLQEELQDNQILVGMSSNTLNDHRIFFRFSSDSAVYEQLVMTFKNQEGIHARIVKSSQPFPCLFIAIDKIELIHQAIHNIQFPRRYWIEQMNLHLQRSTHTFFKGWSILTASKDEQDLHQAKIDKLEELKRAFETAWLTASAEELLEIKNTWAKKVADYTIGGQKVTLTNMELMAYKRGPQRNNGKPAASATLLANMERLLNPSSAISTPAAGNN
ncbi:MAG: Uncharacterized protein K0R48_394 [Gammaproteobacteria bacterium]|jgi:hypothetical protein|nr:Uncharacterized protein [Gammaproteobacteria bacterium]